jgi:hypothetical protein
MTLGTTIAYLLLLTLGLFFIILLYSLSEMLACVCHITPVYYDYHCPCIIFGLFTYAYCPELVLDNPYNPHAILWERYK